jgi:hypothetical protein
MAILTIRDQERLLKRQTMEIMAIKAIEEINATSVTHYTSLLNKFTLLDKEYSEFKLKF